MRLKSGGKSRYLLSGLLRCGVCGAHYILSNAAGYSCSGYLGGDCTNGTRVRRDRVEQAILDPIRDGLLSPERMARMAKEVQRLHAASVKDAAVRADEAPAELVALDTRIARLRERLSSGDPDMESDEIQVAIDRAEAKRRELESTLQPAAKLSAKIISALPKAAEAYRRKIASGLDNDPTAAMEARLILRKLMPNNIRFMPEPDGGLFAEYELSPGAMLKGVGTDGSGGALWHFAANFQPRGVVPRCGLTIYQVAELLRAHPRAIEALIG